MSTEIAIMERRTKAWEMYLRSKSVPEIAKRLRVSEALIWDDLKQSREFWAERVRSLEDQRVEEVARLDQLEREYWEAWEKSGLEKEVETVEEVPMQGGIGGSGSLSVSKVTTQKTGQVGDPRFLEGVLRVIDRRARLLGLDAPTKVISLQVRWELLTREQVDRLAAGEDVVRVLDPTQYSYEKG